MRGVGRVATVNASWRNNPNRRLTLEHRANLDGRSVSTEEIFFARRFLADVREASALGQVERVLRVTCGVIGGCIQSVETVVLGFNFGTVGDGEAHFAENAAHLFADECKR